jgi:hypothetical protein
VERVRLCGDQGAERTARLGRDLRHGELEIDLGELRVDDMDDVKRVRHGHVLVEVHRSGVGPEFDFIA